ncbi:complement factor I [Hoplias malabaricus]|uniref:complement factor I n=1 Tax=Hoplias malabaricus TaxID=27720 RepID=UPI003462F03E
MRIILSLVLALLLQESGHADDSDPVPAELSDKRSATGGSPSVHRSGPRSKPLTDPSALLVQECLKEKYTHLSCSKVLCRPWERCISGKCSCKLPYQCPRIGRPVCGRNDVSYISFCQAQASACRSGKATFSHIGQNCEENPFQVSLKEHKKYQLVQVKTLEGSALICGGKTWNMAAANVICRDQGKEARGADAAQTVKMKELDDFGRSECMSVSCTGSEFSLAECTIYKPKAVGADDDIAHVKCYKEPRVVDVRSKFHCVNEKWIPLDHTCDGVNDCVDNSDEMCCKGCRGDSFHCKSGVCIPLEAVSDGIRDCLGGEDELEIPVQTRAPAKPKPDEDAGSQSPTKPEERGAPAKPKPDEDAGSQSPTKPEERVVPEEAQPDEGSSSQSHTGPEKEDSSSSSHTSPEKEGSSSPSHTSPIKEEIWSSVKNDTLKDRKHIESQLECGIPNLDYVYKAEETRRVRRKRVVGGEEALPTQIQWQVAVQEDGSVHCGGAYLGGCWVLTAAHCVRQKPQAFHIKFSLWKKLSRQNTTDIAPVKRIIIHEDYDPRTYKNDIALIQLEEMPIEKVCLKPNPAVRSVCVPWSTQQFQHGDTCTISGWGRNKEGGAINTLKWANVTIIRNCKEYHKDKIFEGMECAGDLQGKVDSCQGDSGGPLVCKDASGLSYVWGIVSWGEKCGEVGYPGVYTQVAHYFEWIRFHTGWQAVTKFNH